MSTDTFARPPRQLPDGAGSGEIVVLGPPEAARPTPAPITGKIVPLVMVLSVVGMTVVMFASGAVSSNPTSLMFPVMMLGSVIAMAVGGAGVANHGADLRAQRRDYLRYLDRLRDQVREVAQAQRVAARFDHPVARQCWQMIGTARMWERRPDDPDFLHIGIGTATQRLRSPLITPETAPTEDVDAACAWALNRFIAAHAAVDDVATAVALSQFGWIGVGGDPDQARGLIRALVLQVAVHHGPDDVAVLVECDAATSPQWDWVKWLPHNIAASSVAPHRLVVIRDGFNTGKEPDADGSRGIANTTTIYVGDHIADDSTSLILSIAGDRLRFGSGSDGPIFATVSTLPLAHAEAAARQLARYAAATGRGSDEAQRWSNMVCGIDDFTAMTPALTWRLRGESERLTVPIGFHPDGTPAVLDLKEAAEGGMGPHGLCVGATGSGKSELLRSIVLGLIATHSPEQLNLVLVDFKGGATFLGFEQLRHVAAVITNLEAEATLVDRMRDALAGELHRRQELLRAAGNFANVADYELARRTRSDLPALPALFVVIDEFSELLSQQPEFAELFVAIGRLGRSLRIHLLLASQRLDEGRLRGLDSHLSYRLGLKTFSAAESRSVLGVADAYELDGTPGRGLLRTTDGELRQFAATYVSGPAMPMSPSSDAESSQVIVREWEPYSQPKSDLNRSADGLSRPGAAAGRQLRTLDVVLRTFAGIGPAAHQIWLPPITQAPSVRELNVSVGGELRAAVGLIDKPFHQQYSPLIVDTSGADGHVAIVGGPQSGKSTALLSFVMSLADKHDASEVQFYCLDLGGGPLAAISGLSQVGVVASRFETDLVNRTVSTVAAVIAHREREFRTRGVTSMAALRASREEGSVDCADIFLVVDGFGAVRTDFEHLERQLLDIAARGLSYGVHLVLTASRWGELRPAVKDQIGSRIELRLGDPMDSEFGRRVAAQVPTGIAGRGITAEGWHTHLAVPRLDGISGTHQLASAIADAVGVISARGGVVAPEVGLLPEFVPYDLLPAAAPAADATGFLMGLREADLGPARLDLSTEQHLLIFGDSGCGKTNVLRLVSRAIVAQSDSVRILLVDYRRTLLEEVDEIHLAGYATSGATLEPMVAELANYLRARLPGPQTTAAQLRDRSWWAGPEIYLVVDDYDLVAAAGRNPLQPLAEFIAHGRDIGLHVVLARRCAGAARAMYDSVISALRESNCSALVMSGSRDEPNLVGSVRPKPLIPGRGVLVADRAESLIQIAWMDKR